MITPKDKKGRVVTPPKVIPFGTKAVRTPDDERVEESASKEKTEEKKPLPKDEKSPYGKVAVKSPPTSKKSDVKSPPTARKPALTKEKSDVKSPPISRKPTFTKEKSDVKSPSVNRKIGGKKDVKSPEIKRKTDLKKPNVKPGITEKKISYSNKELCSFDRFLMHSFILDFEQYKHRDYPQYKHRDYLQYKHRYYLQYKHRDYLQYTHRDYLSMVDDYTS